MAEGIDLSSLETTSLSQSDKASTNRLAHRLAHRLEYKTDQNVIDKNVSSAMKSKLPTSSLAGLVSPIRKPPQALSPPTKSRALSRSSASSSSSPPSSIAASGRRPSTSQLPPPKDTGRPLATFADARDALWLRKANFDPTVPMSKLVESRAKLKNENFAESRVAPQLSLLESIPGDGSLEDRVSAQVAAREAERLEQKAVLKQLHRDMLMTQQEFRALNRRNDHPRHKGRRSSKDGSKYGDNDDDDQDGGNDSDGGGSEYDDGDDGRLFVFSGNSSVAGSLTGSEVSARLEEMSKPRPPIAPLSRDEYRNQYLAPYETYSTLKLQGGKFSNANPKSDVEWMMYTASEIPGPGAYAIPSPSKSTGSFSTAHPKSALDVLMDQARASPGPGAYTLNLRERRGGGKFNSSRPKSDLEWAMLRAKNQPGPGEYKITSARPATGAFSTANPLSPLDIAIKTAKAQPGPGQYHTSGATFSPSGGKFNASKAKSDLEWQIFYAKSLPGPGTYDPPKEKREGGTFSSAVPKSALDWAIDNAKKTPGPGDYAVNGGATQALSGGKFSTANPKSDVEWKMYAAAQSPGPGEYPLPQNNRKTTGRFSTANPKSSLDWDIYRAAWTPGPGAYHISDGRSGSRGGNASTSSSAAYKGGGGKFSEAVPKSDLDWKILEAARTPGPGSYKIPNLSEPPPFAGRIPFGLPSSYLDAPLRTSATIPGPGQYYKPEATLSPSGGKFNLSKPKSELDWQIFNAAQTPGPGAYETQGAAIKIAKRASSPKKATTQHRTTT